MAKGHAPPAGRYDLKAFEAVGDLAVRDRALFQNLPLRLGDVYGGRAGTFAEAAVKHKIDTAIHDTERLDPRGAGGTARDVGAGRDDRPVEPTDEFVGHDAFCLTYG